MEKVYRLRFTRHNDDVVIDRMSEKEIVGENRFKEYIENGGWYEADDFSDWSGKVHVLEKVFYEDGEDVVIQEIWDEVDEEEYE